MSQAPLARRSGWRCNSSPSGAGAWRARKRPGTRPCGCSGRASAATGPGCSLAWPKRWRRPCHERGCDPHGASGARPQAGRPAGLACAGARAGGRGRLHGGVHCVRAGCTAAPGDALLFSDYASALAQARQFEQAAAWANRALHLDSQCAEAWQALALTHLGRQQPREAALALNRVLAIQPRLAQAHFLYGVALEMLVMPERAELAYREALACAPDHLHANISLAQLASARQDYNTAIACWRAALAADPGNVQLMNDLGTEFSEIGQHAEAVAVWDQALVLQPDNAEVAYNRARSLLVQGFTPEALGLRGSAPAADLARLAAGAGTAKP
ncbi:tetratricopeptide repeat protein [Hankyongella ginsenosidimutans]|uniref:Tetratricopeptide repeat protein n=1 Tax=Hankyongella ginsenosidimutans TaxID=1763828 RepID=A0A4D7CAZ9_9SPHN|nr:tetratricopeptide repeat protein [Hankyongella ginsenosidimutans]